MLLPQPEEEIHNAPGGGGVLPLRRSERTRDEGGERPIDERVAVDQEEAGYDGLHRRRPEPCRHALELRAGFRGEAVAVRIPIVPEIEREAQAVVRPARSPAPAPVPFVSKTLSGSPSRM